jgi:hypothetical protein
MAKKQEFGEKALAARASARKMAKVVIAKSNGKGTYSFNESMVDQESVKDFLAKNKN